LCASGGLGRFQQIASTTTKTDQYIHIISHPPPALTALDNKVDDKTAKDSRKGVLPAGTFDPWPLAQRALVSNYHGTTETLLTEPLNNSNNNNMEPTE
jgi:hypothetical protein